MKNIRFLIPYIAVFAVCFYALPLIISSTGAAMMVMLLLIPAAVFMTGLVHGLKHGFDIMLSALCLVLFVPSIFIFYNISAWVYVPVYGALSLLSDALGGFIKRYEKRK